MGLFETLKKSFWQNDFPQLWGVWRAAFQIVVELWESLNRVLSRKLSGFVRAVVRGGGQSVLWGLGQGSLSELVTEAHLHLQPLALS